MGYVAGRSSERLSALDWAKIWHSKLAKFHNVSGDHRWIFNCDEVIAFLVHQKRSGAPAWKRLRIAQGLALYNSEFLGNQGEPLDGICQQLKRLVDRDRAGEDDTPASDLIGAIDPSEAPLIQQVRRVMRLNKLAWNTEKAYVGKLREFFTSAESVERNRSR